MTAPDGSPQGKRVLLTVLVRAPLYLALVLSLLVFPSGLPWMMLLWLAIGGAQLIRGKAAWPPFLLCVGIILLKRTDWAPGLIVLGLLMLAAAGADVLLRRVGKTPPRRYAWGVLTVMALAWGGMLWNWEASAHAGRRAALSGDRPVVCIGDSLSVYGYPRELSRRLRVPVVDLSTGGICTNQGLEKLPELVSLNPQVVVIELGGHDYLRGYSRAQTRANLERFIGEAKALGSEVILFEIPRGFVIDPFAGLDRQLAREHDLELVPDTAIRNLVIRSPVNPTGEWFREYLSDDGLHPNDAGHRYLADWVTDALQGLYGEEILAKESP